MVKYTGNGSPNLFQGTDGDDEMSGAGGADQLYGGLGNDVLSGGSSDDLIDGGDGIDTLSFATAKAKVKANLSKTSAQGTGEGTDTILGIENIIGSAFNDVFVGSSAANTLQGMLGDDWLDGGSGNDTLEGGDGSDTLFGGNGADQLLGGLGDDVLSGGSSGDTFDGGDGIDTISFAAARGKTKVNLSKTTGQGTGEGTDIVLNVENVIGSAFNDAYYGTGIDNRFSGAGGDDKLDGGSGNDVLDGGDGNDFLIGAGGTDDLRGGLGDDLLSGGSSNDTIDGGDGIDTLTYAGATKAAKADLNKTTAQGTGDGTDILLNIENVIGGSGNDTFIGNGVTNRLEGGDGKDTIDGGGGADIVLGGAGDDMLAGGSGNDILDGGEGFDTVSFAATGKGIKVNLGKTAAQGTNDGTDTITGFEQVIGSRYDDVITGSAANPDLTYSWLSQGMGEINYIRGDIQLSPDGTQVLFCANISLPNGIWYVDKYYLKDLKTGELVAIEGPGQSHTGAVASPRFSADGKSVIFTSTSSDLVAGDTNNYEDIFIRNIATGTITRLSTDADGTQLDGGPSYNARLSADNKTLIFASGSADLPGTSGGLHTCLFAKDLTTGAIVQLDTSASGVKADGYSQLYDASADGKQIVFTSSATNLIDGETSPIYAIYHKNLTTGVVTRIAIDYPSSISFSPDGKSLLIRDSGYTTPEDHNYQDDLFLYDIATGTLTLVSTGAQGQGGGVASYGTFLDNSHVAFLSTDSFLTEGDINGIADIYVKDLVTGAVTRIPLDGLAINAEQGFALSKDMTTLIFGSGSGDLDYGDVNGRIDIYLKNLGYTPDLVTGNDVLRGGAGNDKLDGLSGSDTLYGEDGNDVLTGGAGSDAMYGGKGDDTYYVDRFDGTVVENAGEGSDTVMASLNYALAGNFENLTLTGTADLTGGGNELANTINGNNAGNHLGGGEGADTLYGRDGNDMLNGDAGFDTLYGGNGDDSLTDTGDGVLAYGGEGADYLTFTDADTVAYGGDGGDSFTVFGGKGTLNGEDDDDVFQVYTSAAYVIRAGRGNDSVYLNAGGTAWGDDGRDSLRVYGGGGELHGGAGDDYIDSGAGNDLLYGDDGDDSIYGGNGYDQIWGGNGRDVISFRYNSLAASQQASAAYGGDGDDEIRINNSAGHVDGGAGTDTLMFIDYTNAYGIYADLADGQVAVETTDGTFTTDFDNFENLYGTFYSDILIGDDGDNFIMGDGGDDFILVTLGHDTLNGGVAGTIGDTVFGTLIEENITIDLGAGTITSASIGTISAVDFENAVGSDTGNDTITGTVYDNLLNGGGGNDKLYGMAGDDTFVLSTGSDRLEGGAGIDAIDASTLDSAVTINLATGTLSFVGGSATFSGIEGIAGTDFNDTLSGDGAAQNIFIGGAGNDTMTGGLGQDIFYFEAGSGADTITDFSLLQNDVLWVTGRPVLTQVGLDTRVDLGGGNTILLKNVVSTAPGLMDHIVW